MSVATRLVGPGIAKWAVVLSLLSLGAIEQDHRRQVAAVLDGALEEAIRMAEVDNMPMVAIESRVIRMVHGFAPGATITARLGNVDGVRRPERIITDTAPLGRYNADDCFQDANGNGHFDPDQGRLGGAEDIVRLEVTVRYPSSTPLGAIPGWDGGALTRHALLRNRNGTQTIRCG